MNSVRDLSKDKDIIRIIGGMPDRVLDKDAESEGADILDRIYEVHIGTQGTLIKMLQKAGYKVTERDSYTAVIIGERVSENTLKTLTEGCKKIDVFSIASWLIENKIANKKYTFHKELPSNEISEKTVVTGGRKEGLGHNCCYSSNRWHYNFMPRFAAYTSFSTWRIESICSLISLMSIRVNVEGAISNAPSTFYSINPAAFILLFQTFYFQFRLLVSKYFIISSLPSSVVKVTAR